MKNLIIVIMCIVVHLCLPPGCIEALPPPLNIYKQMKDDAEICKAVGPIVDSNYSKICENIKAPNGDAVLNPNDSEQFLCLGLYDRLFRLCYLDSLLNKSVLPNDVGKFDSEVRKTMPKTVLDVIGFCQKWNATYPPKYDKIKGLVAQLETSLKNPVSCVKLCTDANSEFIPLCSALATMDSISRLISDQPEVAKGTAEVRTKEAAQDQPIGLVSAAASSAVKAGDGEKIVVTQETADDGKATNSLDKSPDASSRDLPKNQGGSAATATSHEGSPRTTLTKEAHAESTQHSEKVEGQVKASDAVANLPERYEEAMKTGEVVKEVKTQEQKDKPTVEKTPPTGANDNAKKEKSPAPSEAATGVAENRETPLEGITDTAGGVPDDSKTDVISEHTQDETEDQFAGADPIEAMDSPLMDDDVDENAIKLSEKQTYIPRLPRLPDADDSHFFSYFTVFGVIFIASYFGYHNKQKILAMLLEGRRSRGGRTRKRPSTANYRKLDCTLEEAVTSQCNSNVTHVIY